MPKKQVNYQNAVIYKIVCNDVNIKDVYVGSTTDFRRRKTSHKKACCDINDKHHHLKVYEMIRNNQGWTNWSMLEIEKYPCADGNEMRARERFHYEQLHANMNSMRPFITDEERNQDAAAQKRRSRDKLRAENFELYCIKKNINDVKYYIKHYERDGYKRTDPNIVYPTIDELNETLKSYQDDLAEELMKPKVELTVEQQEAIDRKAESYAISREIHKHVDAMNQTTTNI